MPNFQSEKETFCGNNLILIVFVTFRLFIGITSHRCSWNETFILYLLTKRLIPCEYRCHFDCVLVTNVVGAIMMICSKWLPLTTRTAPLKQYCSTRFSLGKPFSHSICESTRPCSMRACVQSVYSIVCDANEQRGGIRWPKVYFCLPKHLDKSVNSCMLNLIQPLCAYLWRGNE